MPNYQTLEERKKKLLEELDDLTSDEEYDEKELYNEYNENDNDEGDEQESEEEEEDNKQIIKMAIKKKEQRSEYDDPKYTFLTADKEEDKAEDKEAEDKEDKEEDKEEEEDKEQVKVSRSDLKNARHIKKARDARQKTLKEIMKALKSFKVKVDIKIKKLNQLRHLKRDIPEDVYELVNFHNNLRESINEEIEYYLEQMPPNTDLKDEDYDIIDELLEEVKNSISNFL